jgi:hypothetical protein
VTDSRPTPVEQHLGDRLAALVDGELGHDARERVLAHLATCPRCKAEADAQRRLKSFFAETAPPPPSESFLARLQGLPGGDGSGGPGCGDPRHEEDMENGGNPFRLGGHGRGAAESVLDTALGRHRGLFRYAPAGAHAPVLPDSGGFRIHDVGRARGDAAERSRGRRFAFAAAGAVSMAAIALGGVTAGTPAASGIAGGGPPSNATPLRAPGPSAVDDAVRRRSAAPLATTRSERGIGATRVTPVTAAAPLLPGVPAPPPVPGGPVDALPLTPGAVAPFAPLIRPFPTASVSATAPPSAVPEAGRGTAVTGGSGVH